MNFYVKEGFLKETKMLIETSFSSGGTMSFTMLTLHAAKGLLMSATSQIYSLIPPIISEWWCFTGQEKTAPHLQKALRQKVSMNV